jgi:phage tail sheath protein FI
MGFYLSPSVNVREIDLSTTIPAVATSITGMVGKFGWGACFEPVAITNERNLIENFGKPTSINYEDWYSAWNFLQYGQNLFVVRAVDDTTAKNAGLKGMDTLAVDSTPVTVSQEAYIPNSDAAVEFTTSFLANEKIHVLGKYPGSFGNTLKVAVCNFNDFETAEVVTGVNFSAIFDYAPQNTNQFALVVLDEDDNILEQFLASFDETEQDANGNNIFAESFINRRSKYINIFVDTTNTDTLESFLATSLGGGVDGNPTDGDITSGYDLFAKPSDIDINIVIDGANTSATVQQYIIDNVCELRKDCIAILSATKEDCVGQATESAAVDAINTYRTETLARSSSYAAFYGNWKMQYDKYNDKYRWIPLSGDVAGILAYTDDVRDPWFAPAGYNRGLVKNVVKFAINPDLGMRNLLYKNGVNPVFMDSGEPVVLGQKTLLRKPSSFDRIDVRRLFIVLEKAISTSSKYFLFEKNNSFTRRRFKGMVEPFLKDVRGRQGIYDFRVVCDTTNNTGEVIDRNEFVADIYIKAQRSAEFIVLNFISTKTGVDFNELIG